MCLYITALTVTRLGSRACADRARRSRWRRCLCRSRSRPGTTTSAAPGGPSPPVAIPIVALVTLGVRPGLPGQSRARGGADRARAPRRRERALPDRPGPSRPARSLADDDHGQGRPRAPARPNRSGPVPSGDRRGRGARPPVARRRAGRGQPTTGTSRSRASSPPDASCFVPPGITADLPPRGRRRRPVPSGAVRLGRPRGSHQRRPPCPRQLVLGAAVARAPSRSSTTASAEPVERGNGLSGLRERVAAAGGVVDAGPLQPRGGGCGSRSRPRRPRR